MTIQQNMAAVMQMLKEQRNVSLTEFSDSLEISRSTLQEYITGNGNPSMSMVEHIANKLDVDPLLLIAGVDDPPKAELVMLLFQTTKEVVALPDGKRQLFAELFEKIVSLWDSDSLDEI